MANDINKAITGNPIKNGTVVISCQKTGLTVKDVYDKYVQNYPLITDIENKYDTRFDDPSYYYGLGNDLVVGG